MYNKTRGKPPVSKTHTHLMDSWDFDLNVIRPEDITHGMNKKVWWLCRRCKYSWVAPVRDRARRVRPSGCPLCAREKHKKSYIKTKINKKGSLATTHPHLADEWNEIENKDLRPTEVTSGSNKKVHWICSNSGCSYSWKAVIKNRSRRVKPSGCPACYGRIVTDKNNFLVVFPYAAKWWDKDKNTLSPQEVTCRSSKRVWWKCPVCAYSWKAGVCTRADKTHQRGCLVCLGRVATSTNNLKVCLPLLAEEWDEDSNGDLRPEDITYGTERKVWWVCKRCGHRWRSAVKNRTRKVGPSGCPSCSKGNCSKISQEWLNSLNITVREYKINTENSFIKVDGFDSETNTVYEFLGDYWHGNPERFKPEDFNKHNKKTFGQLYQETMERIEILKENGYKVIYIWERDFKKLQE